jgi:hypothetical protein
MAADDLVSGVLTRISAIEEKAVKVHDERCGLVLGTISGNLNDECDCGVPDSILRLCRAHRQIVEEHAPRRVASLEHATWGEGADVCRRCCVDGDRRVVFPCATLRSLAVGLGVLEETSNDE